MTVFSRLEIVFNLKFTISLSVEIDDIHTKMKIAINHFKYDALLKLFYTLLE